MFTKVLIANRGAIACRIQRTLARLGVGSVAVFSESDAHAPHVRNAGQSVLLGPAPARESYLRGEAIIQAALKTGAQAIHPGYGFLSENADFAEACEAAGLAFIGPTPTQMRQFGRKHTARELAQAASVPLAPGTDLLENEAAAASAAERIGYPIMLKSTGGGGGIGMSICRDETALRAAFAGVRRLGESNFADAGVFLEKYVENARHVEVQVFGDGRGGVAILGERDCTLQRRNQKVVEECPAPNLPETVRQALWDSARSLAASVDYRSAGTVEYLYDAATGEFYFLEVNTRLQVEHGVTEEVWGVDLVEWMLRQAAGEDLDLAGFRGRPRGHAIQTRLYAELPHRNFAPSSGLVTEAIWSHEARTDTWIEAGLEVSSYYDPLLAKIIVHGADRDVALEGLWQALQETRVAGFGTNLEYLREIITLPDFAEDATHTTRTLGQFHFQPRAIEILAPGTMTTVQDFPGRLGYWDVGVPPCGPMDALSFRLANQLVGNPDHVAGLEMTATGATLRFLCPTAFCLAGAEAVATLDGAEVAWGWRTEAAAWAVLKIGRFTGPGCRAYLAIDGGVDVPLYLGSRSTFTLGQFGGHAGRALAAGDFLPLGPEVIPADAEVEVEPTNLPQLSTQWTLRVIPGPHGAPDFFQGEDMLDFFTAAWEVHYNSSRTGVRLIGPKPRWARPDGGEAGLHPSNIHDNAYVVGAIDFTGDMPIILGPDGPSLGGFVCPAVIISADLWKTGQLRPGDTVYFEAVSLEEANSAALELERWVDEGEVEEAWEDAAEDEDDAEADADGGIMFLDNPVIRERPGSGRRVAMTYRAQGDSAVLVEFGEPVLELELRMLAHTFMEWLSRRRVPGIVNLTPGIRSLQVHFEPRLLSRGRLLDLLEEAEREIPDIDSLEIPSRIVHLPLSWDDESTRLAIQRYMQSVRPDAPWCPSNIEFIRRINGLPSEEAVREIVYSASYLVLGLGDVYLGAPVATPLDPRHRLVTTKYNPARTWTPQNAVGIGGAYMCIYGMEGPGGYQFVGRTLQVWNTWRQTAAFREGKPWLLRFFDQVRFYPVSAEELLEMRAGFLEGNVTVRTEDTVFRLPEYRTFLEENADSIAAFRKQQRAAFAEERERWKAAGQEVTASLEEEPVAENGAGEIALPEGAEPVYAPLTGSVWKLLAQPGQVVAAGEPLAILEAMKMETPVVAETAGTVLEVRCAEGKPVRGGQILFIVGESNEAKFPGNTGGVSL